VIVEDGKAADQVALEAAALLDQLLAGLQAELQQVLQGARASLATAVQPLLDKLDEAGRELAAVLDNPAARAEVLKVSLLACCVTSRCSEALSGPVWFDLATGQCTVCTSQCTRSDTPGL
jgi:hypothetical protein